MTTSHSHSSRPRAKQLTNGSSTKTTSRTNHSNNNSSSQDEGTLQVTVLSIHDLPTRDHPSFVRIEACGHTATSGPPSSRHKTYNSFKFSNQTQLSSSNDLCVTASTLKSLYESTFKVEVVYEMQPNSNAKNMRAICTLQQQQQLYVNEPTTLTLELVPPVQAIKTARDDDNNDDDSDDDDIKSTIRLQVTLKGSLRPEIANIVTISRSWFRFMDRIEDRCIRMIPSQSPTSIPNKNMFLIPVVPVLTAVVVMAPILAGCTVVFLPIMVPILVAILILAIGATGMGLLLYGSTSRGRQWIGPHIIRPLYQSMLQTETGQALLYPLGPRPTPVSMARLVLPEHMWGRLAVSLCVDAIGSSSYLIPVLGEVLDCSWAVLQTAIIMAMYDTTTPQLKYVSFLEEILPLTDVVPSATIGWACQFGPQLWNNNHTNNNGGSGSDGAGGTAVTIANGNGRTH
mgnify:CR=1 FL=1